MTVPTPLQIALRQSRTRPTVVSGSIAGVGGGIDTKALGRLTAAVSGVNGTTMGSAGGNQAMQSHNHGVNDPTHTHGGSVGNTFVSITWGGGSGPTTFPTGVASIAPAATGISIQNTGAGASQNVQPTIVSFLPLIRAA